MQKTDEQQITVNPHGERSLLSSQALHAWSGLPVGWVEAKPYSMDRRHIVGKPILALLDAGTAQAEFGYDRRSAICQLSAGAMGFFAPGTEMHLTRWHCDNVRRIMVEVNTVRLGELIGQEALDRELPETRIEFRDDDLASLLRAIAKEVAQGSPNGSLFAESLSLGVALRLKQHAAPRYREQRERGKLTASQAQRIEALVRSQLATGLSLLQMSRETGFSAAHFVRLFKNTFGCAPHQYLLRQRLEAARELLLASPLPLAEIGSATGFSSQSHMTSAFVRAFQITPGELRRRRLQA